MGKNYQIEHIIQKENPTRFIGAWGNTKIIEKDKLNQLFFSRVFFYFFHF